MSAKFLDEARELVHLKHPNLVTVLDVGVLPDQRNYFVMEYLSGGSLGDH